MTFRGVVAFLAAGFTTVLVSAQSVRVSELPQDVIQTRIEKAIDKNSQREIALKELFASVGCAEHLSEVPVKHEDLPNVVCVLPGRTDKQIVIGAHFDKVDAGHGVVDNWSGAAMLPDLYESLGTESRDHTLVFVGFTDEEKGLVGSRDYVRKLTKEQRQRISAMINLDTLGLGPTEVWLSHADKNLVERLSQVAEFMKIPIGAVNVDNIGSADSESFRAAKIPSMTVHSVTPKTWSVLHSENDKQSAIIKKDYYDSYRLLALYLAYIDLKLDEEKPQSSENSK